MDEGSLEMDLGMEFYEQWDWQRFREAESMELEDEEQEDEKQERIMVQSGINVENGEGGVDESQEELLPQYGGRIEEVGDKKSKRVGLWQYDGTAEENDEIACISKMGSENIDAGWHRVVLPQYDGPSEETTSILETAVKHIDMSSYHDDTIFTSLPGEAFGNNDSKVQGQSAALEAAEANKEESHFSHVDKSRETLETYGNDSDHSPEDISKRKALLDEKMLLKMVEDEDGEISESHDDEAKQKKHREVAIVGDESIPNFPEGETGHGDVFKVSGDSISQEILEETSNSKSATIEFVSNPVPVTDVNYLEENDVVGDQITDAIDVPVLGSEDPVLEKSHDYTSSLGEITTDIEAKVAVDEDASGMSNGAEEAHENSSNLVGVHSDIIEEAEYNGNTDTPYEIECHVLEGNTSGFLSNQDLRDLEGKPSSMSTHDRLPVKFTTEGGIDEKILMAVKDTTDESTPDSAETDNLPALTYAQTQVSSITDQEPVNDNDMKDVDLPSLSKAKPSIETREQEIPDSDATTESSQQSPQKLGHIERPVDTGMRNTQIAQIPIADGATKGNNEDKETENIASSFGRECATSSIDPKKQLNEPESMEAESLQNVKGYANGESEAPIFAGIVDSAQKAIGDLRANTEDDTEARPPSAQHSPQKMANKGSQPPGRRSGVVINKVDDVVESIEKKTTLIESGLDEPTMMDTKDKSNSGNPVPEKKKRGRPSGKKISTLSIEESATKQGELVLDASESHEITDIDETIEATKQTPSKEPLANELSTSSPVPEKRKPGRPAGRKISALSTVMDGVDIENAQRETAPMDEESTYSIIGPKSTDGPDGNSLIHSRQEKKRKGRPPGRKSSNLSPEKTAIDEVLDVSNGVTITAPSEDDEIMDESTTNDTVDEMTANSSSPIKRKRGRPANPKPSGSSPKKAGTEEVVEETLGNVLAMATKNFEIEKATSDHKSTIESVVISSSPVKKKRGRPSLKSSGIGSDEAQVGQLPKEALSMPQNYIDIQEAKTKRRSNDDLADSSPERPRKRGRPSNRKVSELKSQATTLEAGAEEMSEVATTEKTTNTILSDSGDLKSTNEPADADSSLVKRKRGRPTSRAASELSPEKTIVGAALKETRCMITRNSADSRINEPVANLKSADEPPLFASPLPEMTNRGKPGSRKFSELNFNSAAEEKTQGTRPQNSIAADQNEPLVLNSSPKRKRGRPANRKPSGTSLERQDIITPAEANLSDATKIVSERLVNVDTNDSEASLSANSSPEKKRRGRPARKGSSLNIGNATNERILADPDAGKNMPTEIVDSDEERDELQEESPPAKKVKPEQRKRGRPCGTKHLDLSAEHTKAGEEHLSDFERGMTKNNQHIKVDVETHKELISPEKMTRGRPSATRARRINNSDFEVTEEEKQISEESKLSGAENEEIVEVDDEQEEPIIEKKKRGRPALPKRKGTQNEKTSEPADDEHVAIKNAISPTGSPKGKVLTSQVPNSSNSSSSSQRQDAFFAEMKAMKISSIQTRNAQLRSEITQKREKVLEISQGLEQPARETVKKHIKLLHDYNDIKDLGQALMGTIAENRGVRMRDLYEEFGVDITD
ncbi:hypothetical protein EYC80_008616 [Monilinia laxa]|uniref:Uncharacterized protein n=1 Tax=Monilinia laxa TaxID=61186 RepID=A0A5N6K0X2_MONLA|nr:hypothetical protein EYC80_008616 [Monilinia laxa]